MGSVSLLDCTLRDGGYINNWKFGSGRIHSIIQLLSESHVEYIECGYLTEKSEPSKDSTKFTSIAEVEAVLPQKASGQRYAVMIDFGTYAIDHLPVASSGMPIIRVCFHKKDADEALAFCEKLIQKGYEVFIQPMVSLGYSDVEFLQLIEEVNRIAPEGFYIVDSFGSMELADFQRLLFLTDYNLAPDICLGYHAHNNLQQAYENAKYMIEVKLQHDIILDASVYGMGRGAGNLNMELFSAYLNAHFGKTYDTDVFLEIMDEYLRPIYSTNYWGYSLPFYLSARFRCHPNYASYFSDKNTLSHKSLGRLLSSLPDDVKLSFSKDSAEHYYQEFVRCNIDDREVISSLRKAIGSYDVLIMAPGKSLRTERRKIEEYIDGHNVLIISVGTLPDEFKFDFLFCSNERRFRQVKFSDKYQVVLTSNIQANDPRCIRVNYSSYLTGNGLIADNPVLMVLQMLIAMGIKKVAVAGFDGYDFAASDNYYDPELAMGSSMKNKMERNKLISEAVKMLSDSIAIEFVTRSLYIDE